MDLDTIRGEFASPSTIYRMAVLLRINDETNEAQLRWQVRQIREKGFGAVLACYEDPGGTAPAPFLSEWWRGVVRWLSEACADEGLQFWIYDGAGWPGGVAGGRDIEDRPERLWSYIEADEEPLEDGGAPSLHVAPDRLLGAAAYRRGEQGVDAGSVRDITDAAGAGGVEWRADGAGWSAAVYHRAARKDCDGGVFPDRMSREAGQAFVDAVYKPHLDLASPQGAQVVGFLMGEPRLPLSPAPDAGGTPKPALPWSDALPGAFHERTGASLIASLPLLHDPENADSPRLLDAFWQSCASLLTGGGLGSIQGFCEENGVALSGRLTGGEHFGHHLLGNAAALPAIYRRLHVPGVDWPRPRGAFIPSAALKYASSAAHLMGRERSFCESFAGSGWDLGYPEMQRILNHEHVQGVSMQALICYEHSLRGPARATAYNPGVSYQQPYWDHFRPFADYAARLGVLTAGGGHVADVLLLYPDADIRGNTWDPGALAARSEQFNRLGDAIREAGYDYDIHDGAALAEYGQMRDGRLTLGDETFCALIAPPADTLSREIAERLAAFARQGLRVVFAEQTPRHSPEGGRDDAELAQLLGDLVGGAQRDVWANAGEGAAAVSAAPDSLAGLLREVAPPDVSCQEGGVVGYHRKLSKGGDLYLLMNARDERRDVEVRLRAQGVPYQWDLVTGEERPFSASGAGEGGTTLSLSMEPYGAQAFLLLDEDGGEDPADTARPVMEERAVDLTGPFRFSAEETQRRQDIAWNFSDDHVSFTPKAGDFAPPGEMPLGDWREHGLPFFSGLGHYRASADLEKLPEGAQVRLELGRVAASAQVVINGEHAGHVLVPPYALDVTGRVRSGQNEVEIIVANTLANYYAQALELDEAELWRGGVKGADLACGLFGPVRFVIRSESTKKGNGSR